jgi:AcrR family transcriptional regulator
MTAQTIRRHRTAKKIQAVAVELAVRDGLANVTTDAIAKAAGISTRSFFNYYPYKEAAILGPPPDYPAEASEAFVTGSGPLLDDLDRLIAVHVARFVDERELLSHVFALAETDVKVDALRNTAVLSRRAQMRALLARRLPKGDPRMIEILAAAIVAATNAATKDWIAGETDDFVAAARHNLALIIPSAELLKQSPSVARLA